MDVSKTDLSYPVIPIAVVRCAPRPIWPLRFRCGWTALFVRAVVIVVFEAKVLNIGIFKVRLAKVGVVT